jgi:hypothetical protein
MVVTLAQNRICSCFGIKPVMYQLHASNAAVCTGSGKTYVSVLLIKSKADELLAGKVAVFLAPRVALVFQVRSMLLSPLITELQDVHQVQHFVPATPGFKPVVACSKLRS